LTAPRVNPSCRAGPDTSVFLTHLRHNWFEIPQRPSHSPSRPCRGIRSCRSEMWRAALPRYHDCRRGWSNKRREFVPFDWVARRLADRRGGRSDPDEAAHRVWASLPRVNVEHLSRAARHSSMPLLALGWTTATHIVDRLPWNPLIQLSRKKRPLPAVEVVALAPDVLLRPAMVLLRHCRRRTGTIQSWVQVIYPVGPAMSRRAWRGQAVYHGFTQLNTASLSSGSPC